MSLLAQLNLVLKYSTPVGRAWLPILFIIRVLMAFIAETSVWKDEESLFVCNTQQPGCATLCYGHLHRFTHPQYWFLQLILVTAPTLLLMAYSLTRPEGSKAACDDWIAMESSQEGKSFSTKPLIASSISKKYYILSLLFKLILEIAFLVGYWYFVDFHVSEQYSCKNYPCPHKVECFYPDAFKKNVFIIIMLSLTGVSILLLMLELILLLTKKGCK
ncbi:gap junction alpha-2 protein-like [Rana temporaria]|uniref:gap junction alpha-2 protein-like n=1 Tax=Rana temporaria TaxID=8407 RepID=UPI001AAD99C5|nr:gap junction alpha-2 protein-like [Rana temporaria]